MSGPAGYRCRDSRSPMFDIQSSPAQSSRSSRPGRCSSCGRGSGAAESLYAVATSLDSSRLRRNKIHRLVNIRFCYNTVWHIISYLVAGARCPHPPAGCLDSIGSVLRSDVDDCGLMKNKIHRLEKGNIISKLEVVR